MKLVKFLITLLFGLALLVGAPPAQAAPAITEGATITMPQSADPKGYYAFPMLARSYMERVPKGGVVRIGAYLFNDQMLVDVIEKNKRRGVNTQMVLDDGYPDEFTVSQVKRLKAILGTDTRKPSYLKIVKNSPMGSGGVHHAKYFAFSTVGTQKYVVIVSSGNPHYTNTVSSVNEHQTIVGRKPIYDAVVAYHKATLSQKNRDYYRTATSGPVKLHFYPGGPDVRAKMLETCKKGDVIREANLSGTAARLRVARALRNCATKGAKVYVIINNNPVKKTYGPKYLAALMKAGKGRSNLVVRDGYYSMGGAGKNGKKGYMHLKLSLKKSGSKTVSMSGTSNNTGTALDTNTEIIVENTNPKIHADYSAGWTRVWNWATPVNSIPKASTATKAQETQIDKAN